MAGDDVLEDGTGTRSATAEPDSPAASGRTGPATTIAFALALGLLAVLLTTSARTPPPVEGRLGQRVELVALIEAEQARNEALAARIEEFAAELGALERELAADTAEAAGLQVRADALAAQAGLAAVRGPGVTATLTDSTVAPPDGADVNDYVIHEEDLQAVINALWAGGAEAMAVNSHRILSTTAIRCVGNVLLLHGTTHSPPYVIEAVGDPADLALALGQDPAVERFEQAVAQFKVGFEVGAASDLLVPAFEGGTGVQVARPVARRG